MRHSGDVFQFLMVLSFVVAINFDGSDHCLLQTSSEDLIKDIVGQTSGFMPRDIQALIADAGANLASGHLPQPENFQDSLNSDTVEDNKPVIDRPRSIGKEDLLKALEQSKKRNASALGAPKVIKKPLTSRILSKYFRVLSRC